METARALVIHAPHDLRVEPREVAAPGPGEVRVRIRRGGICGSDLHYHRHGGFGTVRLKHPMVLGHEVAGEVEAVGAGVTRVAPGDRVAVNPSRPCGICRFCQKGLQNHCTDMRFYGSAMRDPHVDGAFREVLVATEAQCEPVGGLDFGLAAFAEPLAVCLHGVSRAGPLLGADVAVMGAGPIGALTIMAARRAGAARITAVDLAEFPLAAAARAGADETVNLAADPRGLDAFKVGRGRFDAVFECSGAGPALLNALDVVRPRGTVVQLGLGGAAEVPFGAIVAKEVTLTGSFRFHEAFGIAVGELVSGRIDPAPLLSATLPLEDADDAFAQAADRSRAMKVQIAF